MKEKIAQAKELYMFLVDWGMSEGDAKKTALAVVFGFSEYPNFTESKNKPSNLNQILHQILEAIEAGNQTLLNVQQSG